MEEKNELNDILIKNKDNEKGSNIKSILLFSAVTILIFFIGILAFKMISQDDTNKPTEEAALPLEQAEKDKELFEDVPIKEDAQNEAKENLDDMIKRIKETKIKEGGTEENATEVVSVPNEIEAKPTPSVQPAPPVVPAPQIQEIKQKNIVKETAKKPAPAKTSPVKPTQAKNVDFASKKGEFYIQVASLTKFEPDQKFLATITNNNYKYKIVSRKINGTMIKRIYVGPFESMEAAKKELPNVHDKISDSAFAIKD
ncbi:MAG: DedD protein [Campylobacterota bacterium]|nr:DedD protein [Campylobacterota bacterium]